MSNHPLQSIEWEEFRKRTKVKTLRVNGQLLTIHKIPHTPFSIGYLPKGPMPDEKIISELKKIGNEQGCIFIQIEPNVIKDTKILSNKDTEEKSPNILISQYPNISRAFHPLFTKYTFVLDLTKSEDELLKNMHPKTRYNIKIAQKHGVEIVEDNSNEAFEKYIELTRDTTKRQKFFAHDEQYHRLMWETIRTHNLELITHNLTSHLFLAKYKGKILVAWIIFVHNDTLYYPYGASSDEHREVMASNLMMWEVIKWAKKKGLKKFDMWGALGPEPSERDPWFGFHRFKQGYGGRLVEYVGSFDLVIKPFWYEIYKIADKIRWLLLRRSV